MAKYKAKKQVTHDIHVLYEGAVQSVDVEVEFMEATFLAERGRKPTTLREDFCGTARLACEWVARGAHNRAIGVDLDPDTLDWGRQNHLSRLNHDERGRIELMQADVREVKAPLVEVVAAYNYSYWILKERSAIVDYFRAVHASLDVDGLFFLDAFGGTEAMNECKEKRKIKDATLADGTPLAPYTYIWDQADFNPVDNSMTCHISFKLQDGTRLRNAFSYHWRIFTLPEIRDALTDAGFQKVDIYTDGWDEESDDGDGVYEKVTEFEQWPGWLAYIVAHP